MEEVFLKELKEIGVPVKYSKLKESYYYTKQGRLQYNFIDILLPYLVNK